MPNQTDSSPEMGSIPTAPKEKSQDHDNEPFDDWSPERVTALANRQRPPGKISPAAPNLKRKFRNGRLPKR